jgi:hypothetical protein
MRDPRITATLAALRQDLLSGLRDRLIAGGASALDKLLTLVNSSDERVALGACKLILDHLLPQRREITVQTDVPPHDVLSDERLREIFDQLAVEGLLTTPEQRTTYDCYRQCLTEAEADPEFSMVPAGFCTGVAEWERLQQWQRRRFPQLAAAQFAMLRVFQTVLSDNAQSAELRHME